MPTDLDVYFSIFKQWMKEHSRKSLAFDLHWLRAPFWNNINGSQAKKHISKNVESLVYEIYKFTRENKYKFRNFQALESSYKQTV